MQGALRGQLGGEEKEERSFKFDPHFQTPTRSTAHTESVARSQIFVVRNGANLEFVSGIPHTSSIVGLSIPCVAGL